MKIKFIPQNIELEGNPDKTLLQLAQENGISIKSICNGVPSCAECRIRIVEGDHVVPPPGLAELNLIGTSYYLDGRRLSCQVRCLGSMTIDMTEQIGRMDSIKKVKGVKLREQRDVQAKQDTLVLSNNIAVEASAQLEAERVAEAKKNNPGPTPGSSDTGVTNPPQQNQQRQTNQQLNQRPKNPNQNNQNQSAGPNNQNRNQNGNQNNQNRNQNQNRNRK